ncbi:MAG: glycosyl hydrolase family 28 protein [Clostridia bacterium]|nr:glycosyl hydrolase family 28 protein [Clostridia bacterium]
MDYRLTDFGVVPGLYELQTEKIQKVFDMCRENGGRVVVPEGTYRVGALRTWSDTVLYLESGARLIGSDICEDYEVFPVPEGVELRTDMELITYYFDKEPWDEYRRAIISVYGGKNISVIGEEGSLIDGDDCSDPLGEEDYRGPHGIFITNVENITLKGYKIANCGNFMHQIDNCKNITMQNVTCEGGSDGVHLHHCRHILIEDCVFHTGDDNIAGINMEDLTVRHCDLNTSCDTFRVGGSHILVEDCKIWGPGIYPHRVSVVQNRGTDLVRKKSNTLAQHMGRHNLESVYIHFASTNFPADEPYHDITFRNCSIDNVDKFMHYRTEKGYLMDGTRLAEMTLENITFTNLKGKSVISVSEDEPLTLTLKNVTATDTQGRKTDVFDKSSANISFL